MCTTVAAGAAILRVAPQLCSHWAGRSFHVGAADVGRRNKHAVSHFHTLLHHTFVFFRQPNLSHLWRTEAVKWNEEKKNTFCCRLLEKKVICWTFCSSEKEEKKKLTKTCNEYHECKKLFLLILFMLSGSRQRQFNTTGDKDHWPHYSRLKLTLTRLSFTPTAASPRMSPSDSTQLVGVHFPQHSPWVWVYVEP